MHMVSAMVIAAGACNSLLNFTLYLCHKTNFTHLGFSKYNSVLSNFYQLLFQMEIETKYYKSLSYYASEVILYWY